jgi:hypothetical protein
MKIGDKITWHIVSAALRPIVAAILALLVGLLLDAQLLDGQVAAELHRVLSGS